MRYKKRKITKAQIAVSLFIGICAISVFIFGILLLSVIFKLPSLDFNTISYKENLNEKSYRVTDVIDGDTIKVNVNGVEETVRLIGIDAPEIKANECMSIEAANFLSTLIFNQFVEIEEDPSQGSLDRYNRQLGFVFFDDKNVNQLLIEAGLAKEYTYRKPYTYQSEFKTAEKIARQNELGIWGKSCPE